MSKAGDAVVLIVFVALAMVLTRPGSQGPGLITSIGNGFSGAINAATGGTHYRQ